MAMQGDDVAWEQSDRIERFWRHSLFEESTLRAIGQFIAKHRKGVPTELCEPKAGGFNALFRMKFLDGGSAVIRFTKPGSIMFPDEKIKNEVATMRFIQDHTAIPVPFVFHWGTQAESPLGIGSFIIMNHVNHEMNMIDAINTPGLLDSERPILNPSINESTVEMLYNQVAKIPLQLSKLEFPLIGALEETEPWSWEVTRRPLSLPMNELIRVGTLAQDKLLYWKEGLDDWIKKYEDRLAIFLKATVACEGADIGAGALQEEQRLSVRMRESWATGDFWTVNAARKNFAFDCVYWKSIDPRFFGQDEEDIPPEDTWMKSLVLLDEPTRTAMGRFVDRKMAETETRELAWDPDEHTLKQQAAMPQ